MEETLPLLEEEDVDQAIADEEKTAHSQYKWKRRVPSNKFGVIIKAEGKRTDQMFEDEVLSFDGEWNFMAFWKSIFPSVIDETEATKYGKQHEKDAIKKLEQILGVKINEAKKFVDKDHKYLVSIPDGLIDDDKLVEIKCQYNSSKNAMESLARQDPMKCFASK